MFKRHASARFVVHHHGAYCIAGQLPANRRGRNISFAQVSQYMNINHQPVGHHNQCFDVMLQQHFQVTLEAVALVMRVGKNRYVGRLIKRVLNPAHHRGTERIGNVEEHQPHSMAALAPKKPRHRIRPVTKLLGHFLNAFFCGGSDVARQRRVVQDDRYRCRREAAVFRDVPHRHRLIFAACAFQGVPLRSPSFCQSSPIFSERTGQQPVAYWAG